MQQKDLVDRFSQTNEIQSSKCLLILTLIYSNSFNVHFERSLSF